MVVARDHVRRPRYSSGKNCTPVMFFRYSASPPETPVCPGARGAGVEREQNEQPAQDRLWCMTLHGKNAAPWKSRKKSPKSIGEGRTSLVKI